MNLSVLSSEMLTPKTIRCAKVWNRSQPSTVAQWPGKDWPTLTRTSLRCVSASAGPGNPTAASDRSYVGIPGEELGRSGYTPIPASDGTARQITAEESALAWPIFVRRIPWLRKKYR